MIREGQCENCLDYGLVQEGKIRAPGLEDTIWLCEECGSFDAADFEREQDRLDEEELEDEL